MDKNNPRRRTFIRSSVFGLGAMAVLPPMASQQSSNEIFSQEKQRKLNILCMGAHPGDPEFGCGGTMAKYSRAGNNVTLLYLTRGEAYDNTQRYEQSALLRTKEAEKACAILHATPLFAGQVDGNTALTKQTNEETTQLILSRKPDIVFTHWPVDAHPDHQVAGLLVLTAWIRSGKKFHLYFYEVNTGSETMSFTPTAYVDITDVREEKMAAMFAHQTQQPESVYNDFFKAMEAFRGLEAGVKAAEAFIYFKPGDEQTAITGL